MVLTARSRKEAVLISLSPVVGIVNQQGEVMASPSKVVEKTMDEGNRVLGEVVMDNRALGEDIRVKSSLKNQDIRKVDSIKNHLVEDLIKNLRAVDSIKSQQVVDSIKSQPVVDSIKSQPVVDLIKSQPVAADIKEEGTVDTPKVRDLYRAIISRQFVQIRTSRITKLGIKLHLRAEDTVNRLAFLKRRHLPFKNQP